MTPTLRLLHVCFRAATTGNSGVLFYDAAAKTVTQLYGTGYSWQHFRPIEGGWLIGGGSSGVGILYFDEVARTITLFASGHSWQYFQPVEGGYLMSSSSVGTGVRFFDAVTKTTTLLHADGYSWKHFRRTRNGCIICGVDSIDVLVYDNRSRRITSLNEAIRVAASQVLAKVNSICYSPKGGMA